MSILDDIADAAGGKIENVTLLPDGHGFSTMSIPLPKDHWLTKEGFNYPPAPFRMGVGTPMREAFAEAIREATKYAVRASTMNGKEMDFDPDAMIQNMIVGMLGYWTEDGRSKL